MLPDGRKRARFDRSTELHQILGLLGRKFDAVRMRLTKGAEMSDAVDMQALREAGLKTWSEGDFAVVA
jgi:hypothetical protein